MKKLIATLAAAAAVFSFAPDADAGHRRSSCHRGYRHSYSHRHHYYGHYVRGYCAPRVIVRPAYYGGYGYCAPYNGYYNGCYGGGYGYGYAVRPSINLSFGYGHYGGCRW
jgi:hypothetical protein